MCPPLENEAKEGEDAVETEKNVQVAQQSEQEEASVSSGGERSSGLLKRSSKVEAETRSSCQSSP